jgi:hypothetical protein
MAKISARGDRERTRWRRAADGAELVHTQHGRLLHKLGRGHGWTLIGRRSESEARHAAAVRGMERV